MPTLGFLIDTMCANFTDESMLALVKSLLAERPGTVNDIARGIADRDHTLDPKSADTLAEAAVKALVQSGDVAMQGPSLRLARSTGPVPR